MSVNADSAALPGALAAAGTARRPDGLDAVVLFRPIVDLVRVLDQSRSCFVFQCFGEAPDDELPPLNGLVVIYVSGGPHDRPLGHLATTTTTMTTPTQLSRNLIPLGSSGCSSGSRSVNEMCPYGAIEPGG